MRCLLVVLFVLVNVAIYSQTAGKSIRKGNYYYIKDNYNEAEIKYREALEKDPDIPAANYNLGNTKYKKEEYDAAISRYNDAIRETKDPKKLSDYYYNLGNAYFKSKKLKESVHAYKQALRNNPDNDNARHNLFLTQQLLKQQQQQQQNQQNKDQKPPEPSEFAKKLKKQAQELVGQRRYTEAYNLMIEGEKKDKTVAYFRDFTDKIKVVDDINSNS
jgi:tetratricopeptide (TPR) repeat protein